MDGNVEVKNLRKRLCELSNIEYRPWWESRKELLNELIDHLVRGARARKAGDAHLEFESEAQAEWVREQLVERGLAVKWMRNSDFEIGLSVRWSDQVSAENLGTGKISLRVTAGWSIHVKPNDECRKAERFYEFQVEKK